MLFVTEKYVTIFGNGVAITLLAKTLFCGMVLRCVISDVDLSCGSPAHCIYSIFFVNIDTIQPNM